MISDFKQYRVYTRFGEKASVSGRKMAFFSENYKLEENEVQYT